MNRQEFLDTVAKAVLKDRTATHGSPEKNFADIAQLWNWWLSEREKPVVLSMSDVAAMNILMKLARLKSNRMHEDNWVDIAGYAACGSELATGNTVYYDASSTD